MNIIFQSIEEKKGFLLLKHITYFSHFKVMMNDRTDRIKPTIYNLEILNNLIDCVDKGRGAHYFRR